MVMCQPEINYGTDGYGYNSKEAERCYSLVNSL